MVKSSLLLVATLCFASYVSAVVFKGNISASATANGWDYRDAFVFTFPDPPFIDYTSIAADATSGNYFKQFNVSAIEGGTIFPYNDFPYAWIVSGSGEFSGGGGAGGGGATGGNSTNYQLSLGVIATAYLRIEEKAPNGTVVASTSLLNTDFLGFTQTQIKWAQGYQQPGETLTASSVVGTPTDNSGWNINITTVASSVLGVIDLANAVVGPSSLEQIVQINNYKYQSTNNHLSLVMYTVSGSLTADASATITTITSGSGSSQVYFSASGSAVVNGQTSSVSVNTVVAANTDPDVASLSSNFISKVTSKFGASTTFHKVSVDFPAGAEAIAYDPSQGAGTSLPASGSSSQSSSASSSAVVASISFVVLAFVAFLL